MYPDLRRPPPDEASQSERLIIVVGDNGLTLRFIKNLTGRFSFRVVALLSDTPGTQRAEIEREAEDNSRLNIVKARRVTPETILKAGLYHAYAVALMNQDDVENLHLALSVRELSRDLEDDTPARLIIRMYNKGLRDHIQNLLGGEGVFVESDADMVARTYAAAALQQIPPGDILIWGRRLYLTRVPHERAESQWVVANGYGRMEMLPEDRDESVRILCLQPSGRRSWIRPKWEKALQFWRQSRHAVVSTLKRKWGLVLAAGLLAVTLVTSGAILMHYQSQANPVDSVGDAVYLVSMLVGSGLDPEMAAHRWLKVTHAVLVLSGALIVPVLTGAIVQVVVERRYALSEGRMLRAVRDHVVVVGLGNLGTRVVETLRNDPDQNIQVVAIEKDRDAPGVQAARRAGAQVLIGDASRPETLREAEIEKCRSLVTMASQDSANLETALAGIDLRSDLRTVMRIYNDDFAKLVRQNLNKGTPPGTASPHHSYSAPQVAAASFARALTDDEILETIPVREHNAYIAEVTVEEGSLLDDAYAGNVTAFGSIRLLAIRKGLTSKAVSWNPTPSFRVKAGDKLLVLVTRAGLNDIRGRCR
ncbi:potassium channel family protein [Glycomyces buryatensis]|uniref:Potassium transporter TrkA n=1 Tax=Glycomyces buryatensis TaxID=2570927 RepID=A0A4S8QJX5_9ACTN|nr:potassium channel protein [Glycomyces buryatensis]THV43305.1 hypothetical protein FAB82_01095 [Glycomyces buryatensis]